MNAWVCALCGAVSTDPQPTGWCQVNLWEANDQTRRLVLCPKETDLAKIKKPK